MKSIAFTLLALLIAGCGTSPIDEAKSTPEPVELATSPETRPTAPVADPIAEPTSLAADSEAEPTPQVHAADPATPAADPSTLAAVPDATPNTDRYEAGLRENSYRLLLPTTGGVLIVDVEIEINGQPIQTHFNSRMDQVISDASKDSAAPSWPELFKHIAENSNTFGAGSAVNRSQYRAMTNRYDQNRNGRPDRDEVAKYLLQSSPTSSAFRLFGTDSFRVTNRSRSQTFAAMDVNGDLAIDENEIDRAAERLLSLDQNSDRRIELAETTSVTPSVQPGRPMDAWKRSRSKRWGEVAMDMAGHVDWSMLSYMIGDLNRRGPFGQQSDLLEFLDKNHDDSLNAEESKELLAVDPDLRLRVSFGTGNDDTIQLDSISPRIESLVETIDSASQTQVIGDSFRLTARMMPSDYQTNLLPDEAFVMLDANNDGFLVKDEIPDPLLREYSFDDIDHDEDGKLTIEEIRNGLAGEEPFWFIQVRARGAEAPDAVFDWFDQNSDGFLSTREITGAQTLLRRTSSDAGVKPQDIPDSYLVQFGRGDPNQDAQLFTTAQVKRKTNDTRPRWAQAMDFNRDGDITPEEFTGASEQFDRLDTNGDGFIAASEL